MGKVSAQWITADSHGLTLYGLLVDKITDATIHPAAVRVRCQGASVVASGLASAVRFVSAKDSECLDAYALSLTAATTRAARFDANAANCRVYYDALQNAAMGVLNSGAGCFTHQPGDLATALAGDILPNRIEPQGQLTGTNFGMTLKQQGSAAVWGLRGDAFQTLANTRFRATCLLYTSDAADDTR